MANLNLPNNLRTAWMVSLQLTDTGTMYMTSAPFDVAYNGNVYAASKLLQSIGRVADVAKTNDSNLSLFFSGVDIQFKRDLLAANDKGIGGRPCKLYRVIFNEDWSVNQILPRYFGVVNSLSIDDQYVTELASNKPVTFSVTIILKTQQAVLKQRVAGRFTNTNSMQTFFPSDTSFNELPGLRDRIITLGKDV